MGSGEGCREGPGEGFGNLWARAGLTGSTRFPALVFTARLGKNCKNKTLRLGIPPKLIFFLGGGTANKLLMPKSKAQTPKLLGVGTVAPCS